MIKDILLINGQEFLFSQRTMAYLKHYYPRLEVKCDDVIPGIVSIMEPNGFSIPDTDTTAPWMDGNVRYASNFLGGIITGITGLNDSTQKGNIMELKNEGGVHQRPNFGVREIKVTATLYARSENALEFGIDWVKSSIDSSFCGTGFGADCGGDTLEYFNSDVAGDTQAEKDEDELRVLRQVRDVKVLQGVKVGDRILFKSVKAVEIEFILAAANPFIFNFSPTWVSSLKSEEAVKTSGVAEVACDPVGSAFGELITDPNDGAIARPPRPQFPSPIYMPDTWTTRWVTNIPASTTDTWGQLVFVVTMDVSEVRRWLRIRIYPSGASNGGCNYDGEMYVTYIPAGYKLTIDGRTREVYLQNGGTGKKIPASNLVLGSSGRPLTWPVVDCRSGLKVVYDAMADDITNTATISAYLRR